MLNPIFRKCAIASLAAALLAQAAAAATFSIVNTFSDVVQQVSGPTLSADGNRVGWSSFSGGNFVSDSLGHFGDRITVPQFSADGSIAMGAYRVSSGTTILYRITNGVETILDTETFATGLSGDGQRYIGTRNSDPFVADYAPGPPVYTPLVDLPGGLDRASVFAISGNGQVIVGTGATGSGLEREAALWQPSGAVTGLGDLSGGAVDSTARGVSYDGHTIVGWGTSAAGKEAVRWTDGVIESLGLNPGSEAVAVSGDGARIVGANPVANGSIPFLYDESGAQDLRSLLADAILGAGFDPATVSLLTVDAISADGNTIAGTGFRTIPFSSSRRIIWTAVIPEPRTGVLFAAGLLAMAAGRRRRN